MQWYPLSTLVTGGVCLLLAIFVFLKGKNNAVNVLFSLFTFTIAAWCFGAYVVNVATSPSVALRWVRIFHIAAVFPPPLSIDLLYAVTGRDRRSIRWVYLPSIAFLFLAFNPQFISGVAQAPYIGYSFDTGSAYIPFIIFFFSSTLYGLWVIYQGYRTSAGHKQYQLRYFLCAFMVIFAGSIIYFLLSISSKLSIPPLDNLFVVLFVSIIAYAIIRHRLMDINLAITRTAVFMVVYAAVLGLPLLAALSWEIQLENLLGNRWWAWLLIVYAALATAAHYTNSFFQKRAEDRLLAEQRRYQSVLRQASQGMTLIKELDKLLKLIVHLLTRKVRIQHAAIYLWDSHAKRFSLRASRQWGGGQAPPLSRDNPLIEFLHWHRSALVTEELQLQIQSGAKELQPVVSSLKDLGASVLVPSFVEDHCVGILILGEKLSGALYTQDDLQVFQVLASQAALAIENAQFYEELRRTQADLFQTGKMASLGHMAGGMSHQINNRFHVLTILAGTMKSVLQGQDPATMDKEQLKRFWDKTIETLSKVEDNSLRGGDIVKTLLKFSRPSGEYKAVLLPQVVDTALEVVQFRVNMSLFDLEKELPEDLPAIRGDLNQLADCCFNLISNAFDAMQKKAELIEGKQLPPGLKDPTPYRGKIRIRAFVAKRKVEKPSIIVELTDNGVGMTQQDLENLFVPFFTTKATAKKGTGLGLYIIQRIMEQHGGAIDTKSEYGVGTTFILKIPIYQETETSQETSRSASRQSKKTLEKRPVNKGEGSTAA